MSADDVTILSANLDNLREQISIVKTQNALFQQWQDSVNTRIMRLYDKQAEMEKLMQSNRDLLNKIGTTVDTTQSLIRWFGFVLGVASTIIGIILTLTKVPIIP